MIPQADLEEPSLREYLHVIRRRKWPLILSVLIIVAAALVGSYVQSPVYAATAEVLVQPRPNESLFNPNTGQRNDPQRVLQTEARILKSEPVRLAVREKLGYAAGVTTSAEGQTDVISVVAESTNPRRAADVANAYATSYMDFKRKQAVDDLLLAAQEIQAKINDLQGQIAAASDAAKETLIQQQALFKNKLDQLQVDAALRTGGAQLVTAASVPSSPVRPKPVRSAILGFVLGAVLGLGAVFLVEHLDDSVKTKADLERAVPSLPVIGMIPTVHAWKNREQSRVVSMTEPTSPAAEAYRTLRTSIQFLGLNHSLTSVQLTSASAQEGKTTTLANLGVVLARAGQRVVLVCCDLRRPRIHEFFGLDNAVGITSVILGHVSISDALQDVPGVEQLSVLASGPLPPNPSELLSSDLAGKVFASLKDQGALLLIDSPPILPVTDALVLSRHVDATLLVSVAGETTRKQVSRAAELLRQVGAPLVGAVLNGVSVEGSYGYGYGYYRSYTSVRDGNGASDGESRREKKAGQNL